MFAAGRNVNASHLRLACTPLGGHLETEAGADLQGSRAAGPERLGHATRWLAEAVSLRSRVGVLRVQLICGGVNEIGYGTANGRHNRC